MGVGESLLPGDGRLDGKEKLLRPRQFDLHDVVVTTNPAHKIVHAANPDGNSTAVLRANGTTANTAIPTTVRTILVGTVWSTAIPADPATIFRTDLPAIVPAGRATVSATSCRAAELEDPAGGVRQDYDDQSAVYQGQGQYQYRRA